MPGRGVLARWACLPSGPEPGRATNGKPQCPSTLRCVRKVPGGPLRRCAAKGIGGFAARGPCRAALACCPR
eukprot:15469283-Alexandrium_andersonii.AAC.1